MKNITNDAHLSYLTLGSYSAHVRCVRESLYRRTRQNPAFFTIRHSRVISETLTLSTCHRFEGALQALDRPELPDLAQIRHRIALRWRDNRSAAWPKLTTLDARQVE